VSIYDFSVHTHNFQKLIFEARVKKLAIIYNQAIFQLNLFGPYTSKSSNSDKKHQQQQQLD
jgi:hypothetical protein